jgi:hypothetical protein
VGANKYFSRGKEGIFSNPDFQHVHASGTAPVSLVLTWWPHRDPKGKTVAQYSIIELSRALGGHSFSWIYVFEWPLFAGFAVYMWWNLLHGHDRVHRAPPPASSPTVASDKEIDEWNLYLAVMEAAEGDDPT